jgi:hypothetical protein
MVIVENAAAFAFRYGATAASRVGGVFELNSNLSNGGETLTMLAADGGVIKSFTYNDKAPWPGGADGTGYSLVLIQPNSNPDHNLPQSWRPSAAVNGNPGGSDIGGLPAWLTANGQATPLDDTDSDGLSAAAEYVLGANPAVPGRGPLPQASVQPLLVSGIIDDYLTMNVHRKAGTDDVTSRVEVSTDLGGWTQAVRVSAVPDGSGGIDEVWRSPAPIGATTRYFIRMTFSVP